MKSIKYLILFYIFLISCSKDVLDKNPLDKISDADVWRNETMLKAYVINLYDRMPLNNAFTTGNLGYGAYSDQATSAMGNYNNITAGTVSKSSEGLAYWDYAYIRDCNIFLEKMETPLPGISQFVKTQLEGEVRVLRAFAYFEKMKRYGGVPLVDKVIDPFSPIDIKYLKRAKEVEVANFIYAELTTAVNLLSEVPTPRGNINKWTAYALNARAMLWAASIAKYGTVGLDGIVGIPSNQANDFYQKASAAADAVITSDKYSLYNAIPDDKSENYRNIFLDESNSEIIFEKPYDGVIDGHSWDCNVAPNPWVLRGSNSDPVLEWLLRYENIDGSTTQPEFGPDKLYTDGYEPFINKDPRLKATIFFQGEVFPNGIIQTYEAIDPNPTPDPSNVISNYTVTYNGMPSVGENSRKTPQVERNTNSNFLTKKYIITDIKYMGEDESFTNWIEFRLAEMYLAKAEAEFERGNIAPAVTALNMTRSRAGISLVDESSISLEKIRTERSSELAFEVHRYWDLRRWRTAEDVLNHHFQGLQIIYHWVSEKFYFIPFYCEDFQRVFRPEHYYNPITTSRVNNNPELVENPLY